jgi:hypothetical protein
MMIDAKVREQVARTDAFIAEVRELIATTTIDPASLCADQHRGGIRRIANTLDAVDYVVLANLANINTAMRGGLLDVIEVYLLAVGGGPTLDFPDATAFFAQFQPMIDVGLRRYRN